MGFSTLGGLVLIRAKFDGVEAIAKDKKVVELEKVEYCWLNCENR